MKRIAITAAGFVALALSATASSAAPLSGLGTQGAGIEAGIIKVHGIHRSCEAGRWGWHRSTWRGRIACAPFFQRNWRRGHDDRHDGGNFRRHEKRRWN